MRVYIVIVNYTNEEDTINCLKTAYRLNHKRFYLKIIIVNNNTDSQLQSLIYKSKINKLNYIVIDNDKNCGFAKAANTGIKKSLEEKADFVLLLNSDTLVPEDLLEKLTVENPDITGPIIKFKYLRSIWKYDFGGRVNWWTGRTRHLEFETDKPETYEKSVDYVSGCCMMVRKEIFEKIGLLDESYFFYFEDVDFCTRAKRNGYKISINTDVIINHKLSGSIGKWSNEAICNNIRSNFIFIYKNLGWRKIIGFVYLILFTLKIIYNKIIT